LLFYNRHAKTSQLPVLPPNQLSLGYDPYGGKVRPLFVYQISSGSIRSKVTRDPKISKLGQVIPVTSTKRVILWFVPFHLCTKFEADSSFRSKVIKGSQNFEIGSRDPGHAHLEVVLYFLRRRGPSSISIPNLK